MTTVLQTTFVQTFFEEYASALASYSPEKISEFYHVPVTVYSDRGVKTVNNQSETVAFWKEGVKQYQALDIEKARPKVLSEEQLSESTFISKVQWHNYDQSGKKVAQETNVYILTLHNNELKISGLIIMTK